jgi:hypothetical protein
MVINTAHSTTRLLCFGHGKRPNLEISYVERESLCLTWDLDIEKFRLLRLKDFLEKCFDLPETRLHGVPKWETPGPAGILPKFLLLIFDTKLQNVLPRGSTTFSRENESRPIRFKLENATSPSGKR